MKNFKMIFFSLVIFLFNYSCNESKTANEIADKFNDNGKFLDSITTVFKCEKITLEKWEATGVTDSTFSISIINAKILPQTTNVDSNVIFFTSLSKSISKVLKDNIKYNSYQIVYVITDTAFGQIQQLNKTSMIVSKDEIR